MKQSIILTIAISVLIASCSSDDDYTSPLKNKRLDDVTFESTASSMNVHLGDIDLSKISVKTSESWCLSSVIGSTICINVNENDSYNERSATVTIFDSGDDTKVSFIITQKQNDAILIDKTTYDVEEEGGTIEIEVQSNVIYGIEILDADWITQVSNTRGLEKSAIILNVAKNRSGDVREAMVKISDGSSREVSIITIKQAFTPYFDIDKTSITFDENGGEDEVTIDTNVEIDAILSDNWVEITDKEFKEEKIVYKLKIKSMDSDIGTRNACITFKNAKWNISKTLSITQDRSLYIKESSVSIYVGDYYSLNYINNTGGTISWKSSDTAVATVDGEGNVTGIGKGTATITVSSKERGCSYQTTISVADILDNLSSSFDFGWTSVVTNYSAYSGYFLKCIIKNNSSRMISLTKCDVYKGSTYLDTQYFNTNLKSGASKDVKLISSRGFSGKYTFVWQFTFNGRSYSYSCSYVY